MRHGTLTVGLGLAVLTAPLARAGISVFAISTFDTDYLLVQEKDLEEALVALSAAGHNATQELQPRCQQPQQLQ